MNKKSACGLALFVFTLTSQALAQTKDSEATEAKPNAVSRMIDNLFNYLNMAGAEKSQRVPTVDSAPAKADLREDDGEPVGVPESWVFGWTRPMER
jgi:hypothetical protein